MRHFLEELGVLSYVDDVRIDLQTLHTVNERTLIMTGIANTYVFTQQIKKITKGCKLYTGDGTTRTVSQQ